MGDSTQKGAMFMAGLTLLQSLRVALTGAKFTMDRFKIPQQYASSFINMVHNPMELATFTGILFVNARALLSKEFKYFAIFTNVALCFSFILLLIAFTSGGEQGDLTFYYWTIVFVSFVYGLNVAAVMTVGGGTKCNPKNCKGPNCQCCKEREGTISTFNAFLSQGLMIILAFTGDGYLKTYSKYEHDRDKWPTKDYGFWKSICYWTGSGMWVACKSVKSSFTKNVRCKVLGKSEALLIVYADEEF